MTTNTELTQINILEVMRMLPHRYPFLLIDRVLSVDPAKSLTAIKNVTINEEFFTGHFAQYPVMPGVLIVEAMAQAAGILIIKSFGERKSNELYFFAGIDKARFKRQVIPGDQLVFEITLVKMTRGVGKFIAVAKVDGQVAAEAELLIAKKELDFSI